MVTVFKALSSNESPRTHARGIFFCSRCKCSWWQRSCVSKLTHRILRDQNKKLIELAVIVLIFIFGINIRVKYFGQQSKDIYAFERAIDDLLSGVNPYYWSIESFSNKDDPSNHGFVYLPSLLYLYTHLLSISQTTGISHIYLWKIPILLADIGVGLFLLVKTKNDNIFTKALALGMWFFNPYAYFRGGYTYIDPLTVFFMMLSLHYLKRNNALSGFFYATAISFKTFPYLILPVFLLKLFPSSVDQIKKRVHPLKTDLAQFILAGLFIAVLISLPLMKTVEDFKTYIMGTVLIHSNRFLQGRPFLFYISYYYKIELFQIIPFKTYTLLASFSGWVVLVGLYLKKLVSNRYVMALIPFLGFYLFTPVLNRTYLIWFTPIFVLALKELFKTKFKFMFYATNIAFYVFYAWYLIQWEDGFHVWHP